MTNVSTPIYTPHINMITIGLLLGLALLIPTISLGRADDHHDNNKGRDRHRHGHQSYYDNSTVVYAPPVIYSTPPEYVQPGINLIVPLHFR